MRITYICADPGVPVFGHKGCSVHVQEVLRALVAEGATVTLFAMRLGGAAPPELAEVTVHRIPRPPKAARRTPADRERHLQAANAALGEMLHEHGPFDLVYERYALWSEAGMAYAAATRTPGILEVNAPLIEEQATHRGLVDRAGAHAVARRTFADASALWAVSDGVADYLTTFAEAQGRIQVVPNGVDPARFHPDVPPADVVDPEAFTVGFVGTLKPWHGVEDLVAAFARLRRWCPEARLLLVGDGPERERLEAQLADLGLASAAHITGAVHPAEVPALLRAMDVAVAPYPASDRHYFSPLKLFEYMAAGVPIVASRIGQVEAVIEDAVHGLLYTPGDVEALAEALHCCAQDPMLRERLGQQARRRACTAHTWAAIAQRIVDEATRLSLRQAWAAEVA